MPLTQPVPGFDPIVKHRPFSDYAPRFKDHFLLENDNGVVTARWHTNGKGMLWGRGWHKGIGQLCADIHQDGDIDVLILGGSGHNYMGSFHPVHPERGAMTPTERYDVEYYDGTRTIEALVGLEQTTIGVLNGPGVHTEYAVFCDITLIADNANICDPHFSLGAPPGDGVQIAWREAMGQKRYNYAALTNQIITPQMAVDYGLANEIVPADKIYDRAREIAHDIASKDRIGRALTTQILRAPMRRAIAWELRHAFGTEMFSLITNDLNHETVGKSWVETMDKLGMKHDHESGWNPLADKPMVEE